MAQFLDEWLPGQRHQLKETTWASYSVAAERIKRHLGRRALADLAPLEIGAFYAELSERGAKGGKPLKPRSVRNTHVVLRKALADAERLGLVARNAAGAARPPSVERVEHQTWSIEQLRRFFDHVEGDRFLAAYVLAATTGMRRGEVLGLRWGDIDFDAGHLAVVHTLTTVNYQPVVSTPKTKRSRRLVYLDSQTIEVLEAQRAAQNAEQRAAGADWANDLDLVITDEFGRPVNPDWFSREFTRQVGLSGLPRIRLHDLRHTYATLALTEGVHPKVVSEGLGHATVGVTLDVYSHVTPPSWTSAEQRVDDVVTAAPTTHPAPHPTNSP